MVNTWYIQVSISGGDLVLDFNLSPYGKKCEFYLVLGPFLTGIGYIPDSITGRDRTVPKNFNHRRVRILLSILRIDYTLLL